MLKWKHRSLCCEFHFFKKFFLFYQYIFIAHVVQKNIWVKLYIKFCSLFILSSEVHFGLTQISAELLANFSVEQVWSNLCETCCSQQQSGTIERDSHVTYTLSFEEDLI